MTELTRWKQDSVWNRMKSDTDGNWIQLSDHLEAVEDARLNAIADERLSGVCVEVKPGYEVDCRLEGADLDHVVPLAEALTIRSVEDVRREAFEQLHKKWVVRDLTQEDFNTPAPSRETQPTPEPVVWITTDPDIADFNGFVDARINPEGEFTRPLRHPTTRRTAAGEG